MLWCTSSIRVLLLWSIAIPMKTSSLAFPNQWHESIRCFIS